MPPQQPQQIPVTPGAKRIMETIKDELFPEIERLKEILVEIQSVRISWQLFSPKLQALDRRYAKVLPSFFKVVTKLETPNILFQGLEGALEQNTQNVASYFQFQTAFKNNISEGVSYVEIIDRTLDRKSQNLQNNRTFLFSALAIVISVVTIFWNSQKEPQVKDEGGAMIATTTR